MRAFTGLKGDPESSYDAIVIGAGIGGLICANLLAGESLRVLLVEQHFMAGGYCSTFRRAGFTFDAATHFYPLLGNPVTITGSVLERIGCRTRWVKMDPVDHFHFPDGSSFSVSANFDEYVDELKATFPHQEDALDKFFALAREAYLYGLLFYFRGRLSDKLRPLKLLTLQQVLEEYFEDRKLRLLLSADCAHWGSKPSTTSFVFDSMLRLSYFLGNYYPEGGSQVFADDLARAFEERGGHVLMSSPVERIIVENGAAVGVEMETGPRGHRRRVTARARHIVSNADLVLTLEKMLGPAVVGEQAIREVKSLKATSPCFLTHIGLKGVTLDDIKPAAGYHWRSWDANRVQSDAFKIFIPTMYEPKMAPPDGQIVILQRVHEIDYDGVADWAAHKAGIEHDLMDRLEAASPGIGAHVVTKQSASALTSWRFTKNFQGAMLGWEMSPAQLGAGRPAIESPVKNLHFTGHWTRPGGGITPVIVSAMHVARAVTGTGVAEIA
ncbi:MAG TPA: NAD(P)/FAD-dependent oxidoreductase [Vicinamibacterales bacterium]|jgi:phytoene dehydrogenase-like protein|nr:NAD(P)/FAD-dependent oxidoreductase [Vicinamibacterales bacterium]